MLKTVRFVLAIVLLFTILIAFFIVLSYTYFHKKSGLTPLQEKIRLIAIVYMISAVVVVIILMAL